MIDDRTPGRDYLLPNVSNKVKEDLPRIRATLLAIDSDITGALLSIGQKAAAVHDHQISEIVGLVDALGLKQDAGDVVATLDDLTNVNAASPASNQVLMYVGSAWVPVALQVNHMQGLEALLSAKATQVDIDNAITALTNTVNGKLTKASNLNDVPDKAAARTALGVGSMAIRNVTVTTGAPSGGADGDVHFKVP